MDLQESLLEIAASQYALNNGLNADETIKCFEATADFIYGYVIERISEDTPPVVYLNVLRRVCDLE